MVQSAFLPSWYWDLSQPGFRLPSNSGSCGTLALKRVPPSCSPSDLLNHNQESRGNQSPWEQLISWGYMVTTKTKSCVCGLECHSNCQDVCNPEYAEACLRFNGDRLETPSCVSRKHWYPFLWGLLLLLDQDANHADGLRPVPRWLGSGVSSSTDTRCCASLEERPGCLWAPVAPEKTLAPCCSVNHIHKMWQMWLCSALFTS